MLTRYDDVKDVVTPEEVKEFYLEFNEWLKDFAVGVEETCSKIDELER